MCARRCTTTGGTTAFDSVGGVNGTLVGGVAFTTTGGIAGGAIQITDGYVDMGNNFASTATFSLQAWAKLNLGDTSGLVPVGKHWGGIPKGYFLAINDIGDGYTHANAEGFYSADGLYQTAVGGPPVNDGSWHQLVGVYNNGVTSIYVDGSLAGSGAAGYANNGAHFMVGGLFNEEGKPINFYRGLIDEVKVFDNALSGADVRALYDSTLNSVPIPGSVWLFGSGIAGLGGLAGARFKRKNVSHPAWPAAGGCPQGDLPGPNHQWRNRLRCFARGS